MSARAKGRVDLDATRGQLEQVGLMHAAAKLAELSRNTMLIDQYPGAQLGQEPQVLQLVKAGDIEFCISSSANAATLSPQSGVMSLHFLFKSEDHLRKSLADARLLDGGDVTSAT